MNTYRSAVKWIGISVAVGLIMGWVALAQEKPRLQKNVIILPGTAISKDDEKAMNAILKQYDKSLYRIDTYEKGKRTKTQGTLNNVVIGRKLMSEVAEKAKTTGFTQYALRIGLNHGGTGHVPSPNPHQEGLTTGVGHVPPTPPANYPAHAAPAKAQDQMDSAELVKKLKPIFEKYSKQ